MGELINLNPQGGIPDEIARDTEVASAIAAHVAETDPHPTYLAQPEADARYRQSGASNTFDVNAPAICFSSGGFTDGTNPGNRGLEIKSDAPSAAYMTFHVGTQFAYRFGLDPVDNELKIGGWSYGTQSYRLWNSMHGTPVWQMPSDQDLKRGIRPIRSALQLILESRPVSFEFKAQIRNSKLFGDKFQRGKIHYGFIAQDFPLQDLVSEKPNGYLGIDYIEIIPFLIRAIQEQQEQIEELKLKQLTSPVLD